MIWRNLPDRYGVTAKFFHWTVAAIMIAVILLGLYAAELLEGPAKAVPFFWHKSLGLTVLALAVPRFAWKLMNKPNPLPVPTQKRWETGLAKLVHGLLYWAMFTMPLSGWAMSSAGGRSVTFFGWFTLPPLVDADKDIGFLLNRYHVYLAWTILGLLALHLAGALKHHFLDKDDTIRRMIPFGKLTGGAALAIALMLALQPAAAIRAETPVAEWVIDRAQSSLTFEGTENREPFSGKFGTFDGDIAFDPARPGKSRASITVDLRDVSTGAPDIDENIGKKEWFNTAAAANAVFTANTFESIGDNQYVAHGMLSLRAARVPVDLPFALTISPDGQTAQAVGRVILRRLDFGLGTGEWADPKVVGADVTVKLKLTAHRKI